MRHFTITALSVLILSACTVEEPVVSAFNGDSVNIIQPVFAAFNDWELQAKANDICRRGNKKFAERVSRRELPDLQGTEYLFLCLDRPSA